MLIGGVYALVYRYHDGQISQAASGACECVSLNHVVWFEKLECYPGDTGERSFSSSAGADLFRVVRMRSEVASEPTKKGGSPKVAHEPCCEAMCRVERVPGDATTLTGWDCPIHGRTTWSGRRYNEVLLSVSASANNHRITGSLRYCPSASSPPFTYMVKVTNLSPPGEVTKVAEGADRDEAEARMTLMDRLAAAVTRVMDEE